MSDELRRAVRWAAMGALAGYLVGIVLAVPVAAVVFGEPTTTAEHRTDLWASAFWGGVLCGVIGAGLGVLRARSVPLPDEADGPDDDTAA